MYLFKAHAYLAVPLLPIPFKSCMLHAENRQYMIMMEAYERGGAYEQGPMSGGL